MQENELATNCSQLKLLAADGKRYMAVCIEQMHVAESAKVIPNKGAMYKNVCLGVEYDFTFLERFFRNLLLGESNELKSRTMLINAPEGLTPTNVNQTSTQETNPSTQETNPSTQEIILSELRKNPKVTRNELAVIIGITPDGIKKQLDKLRKTGTIKHIGSTKAGEWVVVGSPSSSVI